MAAYLSGGGRTYCLDLEIVKPTPTSSWTSQTTSSPSSTISESSNSPRGISTRKPRTPRKRPNQTYNEAAALLSTAYPNLFSTQNLTKPWKSTKPCDFFQHDDSPELLLPFRVVDDDGCLIQSRPERPESTFLSKGGFLPGSGEVYSPGSCDCLGGAEPPPEDFDTGSILDEEIEEGIDSIMGNSTAVVDGGENEIQTRPMFAGNYPLGLGFGGNSGFGLGIRRGIRAMRGVEDPNWWNFPTVVDMAQLSNKAEKKKKKKKVEKLAVVAAKEEATMAANAIVPATASKTDSNKLLLKLNYDGVLKAWSDGTSAFTDDTDAPAGTDVAVRF